jgi:F-type H+-transporting ATPase subunit gamma
MPSLKTIRKRIGSVKSTQKITRAMKMVAGARLNRAQQRITALRPYAEKTQEILEGITSAIAQSQEEGPEGEGSVERPVHKLLARRSVKKALFVVLSSDRGLCGGYNANVLKQVMREWETQKSAGVEVTFATVGKKAREAIVRRKGTIAKDFPKVYEGLDMAKAKLVTDYVTEQFLKAEVDAVYVIYTEFKSAMTQKPSTQQLLPLAKPALKVDDKEGTELKRYDYEPSEKTLLSRLVPMYVEISLYRALLDAQASEFGARMTAMDSATRNAKDMIDRLTLVYNRARQAAITKELMEIIGGAEALK